MSAFATSWRARTRSRRVSRRPAHHRVDVRRDLLERRPVDRVESPSSRTTPARGRGSSAAGGLPPVGRCTSAIVSASCRCASSARADTRSSGGAWPTSTRALLMRTRSLRQFQRSALHVHQGSAPRRGPSTPASRRPASARPSPGTARPRCRGCPGSAAAAGAPRRCGGPAAAAATSRTDRRDVRLGIEVRERAGRRGLGRVPADRVAAAEPRQALVDADRPGGRRGPHALRCRRESWSAAPVWCCAARSTAGSACRPPCACPTRSSAILRIEPAHVDVRVVLEAHPDGILQRQPQHRPAGPAAADAALASAATPRRTGCAETASAHQHQSQREQARGACRPDARVVSERLHQPRPQPSPATASSSSEYATGVTTSVSSEHQRLPADDDEPDRTVRPRSRRRSRCTSGIMPATNDNVVIRIGPQPVTAGLHDRRRGAPCRPRAADWRDRSGESSSS